MFLHVCVCVLKRKVSESIEIQVCMSVYMYVGALKSWNIKSSEIQL